MEDFKQRYIAARRAVIAQDLQRLNPMQRQACHAYIAQQGWNFVDELSEKGVSGRR